MGLPPEPPGLCPRATCTDLGILAASSKGPCMALAHSSPLPHRQLPTGPGAHTMQGLGWAGLCERGQLGYRKVLLSGRGEGRLARPPGSQAGTCGGTRGSGQREFWGLGGGELPCLVCSCQCSVRSPGVAWHSPSSICPGFRVASS